MSTMTPLDNQRFLIVGGSSGIGLATAEAAAAAGARVTIAARDPARLAAARDCVGGS
ncbi:SDR family NAD(P)-dependent oxidoreductase, partial [Acinetobacter baumannii]